jgi:DNA-binding XRE family transcriptional regulator
MVEPTNKPPTTDVPLDEIVDGLARTGREIEALTARLGKVTWDRERLMFAAWTQGINVRLIAKLAKSSRTTAQQVAERHADDPKSRRQDRSRSATVEQIARNRGLLDDDAQFDHRAVQLGTTLRRARLQRGMSQTYVARLAGIQPSSYVIFENGRRYPSWLTIVKLANILNISLDDLARRDSHEDG